MMRRARVGGRQASAASRKAGNRADRHRNVVLDADAVALLGLGDVLAQLPQGLRLALAGGDGMPSVTRPSAMVAASSASSRPARASPMTVSLSSSSNTRGRPASGSLGGMPEDEFEGRRLMSLEGGHPVTDRRAQAAEQLDRRAGDATASQPVTTDRGRRRA